MLILKIPIVERAECYPVSPIILSNRKGLETVAHWVHNGCTNFSPELVDISTAKAAESAMDVEF
jgi:hypothetical protein